jgi:endonuclease YncB( thermonuclease family)
MKFKLITILILSLIFFLSQPIQAGEFEVVRVYNGDTLRAIGHEIEIKVRLVGIDAPETKKGNQQDGQPYSQKAKKFLASMVMNKNLEIKGFGLGPYNRVLGVVYVGDLNINLEMVKAGLAEVYRGKQPRGFDLTPYRLAEKEAKKSGIGMWSLGDKYILSILN